MKHKTETGLSIKKEDILKEGIEIKLNQADIIDTLVELQLQKIDDEANSINKKVEDFYEEFDAFIRRKHVQILKKLEKSMSKKISIFYSGCTWECYRKDYTSLYEIKKNENLNLDRYSYRKREKRDFSLTKVNATFTFIASINVDGEEFTKRIENQLTVNIHESFRKSAEEIKQKVDQFMQQYGDQNISEKIIAKKIKNQFTKEIMKTMSPDFKEKLRLGFGFNS